MSNTIWIPQVTVHLDPNDFDYSKLNVSEDVDGNSIVVDEDGMSFIPAERTTRRELLHFLNNTLVKAAKYSLDQTRELAMDIPEVRDECDRFKAMFTLQIRISPSDAFAYFV